MAILSYKFGEFGEVGVTPRKVYITCNDILDDVTDEGYANGLIAQGNQFFTTDEVHINYGTSSELFNIFTPTINGLNVTLNPSISIGGIDLPVISGNIPKFVGTDGSLEDSGISPSNAAKTKMVMANGATVVGNFGKFADTAGTLSDAGMSPSNAAKTKVCMANAATVINNLIMATDTEGTLGDSGINLKFGVTVAWAGGGTSHTYAAAGLTSSYSAIGILVTSQNAVSVVRAAPATDTIGIGFDSDPGTNSVVFWIAIKTS